MSEWSQGFAHTQNMGWRFLLCSSPPAIGTVDQTHQVTMSSQIVMSSKQASNNPDCVLLQDSALVFAFRTRVWNQFPACLWVLTRSRHIAICWCPSGSLSFFLYRYTKAGSGPTNWRTVLSLESLSAISSPSTVPHYVQGHKTAPQSARWKCSSKPFGTVVSMEKLFWQPEGLSEPTDYQSKSGLAFIWMSWAQDNVAYISVCKTAAYCLREMLSFLPEFCPLSSASPPPPASWTHLYTRRAPLTSRGVPSPLVDSSLVNIVTLYLG
jgi:hypothetical protein